MAQQQVASVGPQREGGALRLRKSLSLAMIAALVVALLGSWFGMWEALLPSVVGDRFSNNTEAMFMVLILVFWIEFVRPRVQEWPQIRAKRLLAATSLVSAGLGLFLLVTELPTAAKTMDEVFLALAVLIPFLHLPRPVSRTALLLAVGILFATTILLNRTWLVTTLAEFEAFLILLPVGFDIVDRWILDPAPSAQASRSRLRPRVLWYGFIVGYAAVASFFAHAIDPQGVLGEAAHYLVRTNEAAITAVLIPLYFVLARSARSASS